jgi:uncharacterized membrane protein YbjE (DUF340 family)
MSVTFKEYSYTVFIAIIFIIKIAFIVLSLIDRYFTKHDKENTKKAQTVAKLKEKFDLIFIMLMSLLLIYFFNKWVQPVDVSSCDVTMANHKLYAIGSEEKMLFFLYGVITLIDLDYGALLKK